MTKTIGLAIFFLSFANVASTTPVPTTKCVTKTPSTAVAVCAPEMDRGSAMAGLTMLLGGVAVILGRRAKKSKA
jgi:predicted phage tail protein